MAFTLDLRGILFPNNTPTGGVGIYDGDYTDGDWVSGNAWRIASPYRAEFTLPMVAVHPRTAEAGADAAWRWLTTKVDNEIRLAWRGGEPPFKITMTTSPSGATIGDSGTEQTFTRTADPVVAGMFRHSLPPSYATVKIPAASLTNLASYNFVITVQDQNDAVITYTFTSTADDSKFRFYDSVSGNDSNAGTFASPFQTFVKAYGLSGTGSLIHVFSNGTYTIHNGSGGTATISSTRPRSMIGVGNSVVFDMTTATFGGAVDDFTLKNVKLSGAPAAATNPRQISTSEQSDRMHICKVKFDTRKGTVSNDNPCGLFMTDFTSPSYHDYTSVVDCELLPTSEASMVVYFQCQNTIEENCFSSGVVFPVSNGSLVSHQKDGSKNNTYRFCDYSSDSENGVLWVSNQDYASCENTEIVYCRLENFGTGNSPVIRWNGQVHSAPMVRPAGQYAVRNSIIGGDVAPFEFEAYVSGSDVNYSGILWSSSTASTIDSTGGVSMTTTSAKVADVNTIAEANLGIRGWVIASTEVV